MAGLANAPQQLASIWRQIGINQKISILLVGVGSAMAGVVDDHRTIGTDPVGQPGVEDPPKGGEGCLLADQILDVGRRDAHFL